MRGAPGPVHPGTLNPAAVRRQPLKINSAERLSPNREATRRRIARIPSAEDLRQELLASLPDKIRGEIRTAVDCPHRAHRASRGARLPLHWPAAIREERDQVHQLPVATRIRIWVELSAGRDVRPRGTLGQSRGRGFRRGRHSTTRERSSSTRTPTTGTRAASTRQVAGRHATARGAQPGRRGTARRSGRSRPCPGRHPAQHRFGVGDGSDREHLRGDATGQHGDRLDLRTQLGRHPRPRSVTEHRSAPVSWLGRPRGHRPPARARR